MPLTGTNRKKKPVEISQLSSSLVSVPPSEFVSYPCSEEDDLFTIVAEYTLS